MTDYFLDYPEGRLHLNDPSSAKDLFPYAWDKLSGIRRFTGQGITVLDHSFMVCDAVARAGFCHTTIRLALLHDACEGLIGDIPAPVKAWIKESGGPDISDLEKAVVEMWVDLPVGEHHWDAVHLVDSKLAILEAQCIGLEYAKGIKLDPEIEDYREAMNEGILR